MNNMADSLMTYETFQQLAGEQGLFAALEHLQSQGTPLEIAATFDALNPEAYWKQKDLAAVIALTTAGIQFCLHQARATTDPLEADSLRSTAKGLAYNLGSFTWPGWEEPGITPSPTEVKLGLAGAQLNLQLAYELQKPPERIRGAHWLLGAQLLAAGNFPQALDHLQKSVPPDPSDPSYRMFHGYVLLAQNLQSPGTAETEWNDLLKSLEAQATEESKSAYEQLTTAWRGLHRYLDSQKT